jgi:hypothetical protein
MPITSTAYVMFGVCSTELSPQEIGTHLGLTPSRMYEMGTPTGKSEPATHPYHHALFHSRRSPCDDMTKLIIDILDLVEPLKPKLELIADRCTFTVHCNYVVAVEGGWELSSVLLERMSSLGISFLFSLDEHSKTNTT